MQNALDKSIENNKKHNNGQLQPERDRKTLQEDPYYVGTRKFEIGIGNDDPVLFFRQWCDNFWGKSPQQ